MSAQTKPEITHYSDLRIGMQIQIVPKCPSCSGELKVIAKLPLHQFTVTCPNEQCNVNSVHLRIRNGKVTGLTDVR